MTNLITKGYFCGTCGCDHDLHDEDDLCHEVADLRGGVADLAAKLAGEIHFTERLAVENMELRAKVRELREALAKCRCLELPFVVSRGVMACGACPPCIARKELEENNERR